MNYPIHLLTTKQTNLWWFGSRSPLYQMFINNLRAHYRGGVGIAINSGKVVATISPDGTVTQLPQPHRQIELHEAANAPKRADKCPNQCGNWLDADSGMAWKDTGSTEPHHPVCLWRHRAQENFKRQVEQGYERLARQRRDGR